MNRQEIADQIEALHPKYEALRKAAADGLDAEKTALQAACGEIGHVYRKSLILIGGHRKCAICDQWEPVAGSTSPLAAEA